MRFRSVVGYYTFFLFLKKSIFDGRGPKVNEAFQTPVATATCAGTLVSHYSHTSNKVTPQRFYEGGEIENHI